MELLTVPKKFNRCGIKVKCLHCKWQLNGKSCHQSKGKTQSLNKCDHKDQHRYNAVVSVPNGKNRRRMKILDTRNFDAAMEEMRVFKEEIKINGYHKTTEKIEVVRPTYLNYVCDYLDSLSGINTPLHLVRKVTPKHLSESKLVLERFGMVLKKAGYNVEIMQLTAINDRHVEMFYKYIKFELKLSNTTYNKYFVIMKTFFNWSIKVKEVEMKNPFAKAKLHFHTKEKTIIKKDEFDQLLKAITLENGGIKKPYDSRSYYRPWLKNAYRLALQTGTRTEELAVLKWSDIIELENGIKVFKIQNLKVNRIQTGEDSGANIRYIPITRGLNDLLVEMGLKDMVGKEEYIISRENNYSTKYVMQLLSKGFSHYIKKAATRKIEFKDLRKTYITKLTMALGSDAKMYTGHASNEVIKNHYLSNAYLAGNLKDFDVL
jgi:integrase